MVVLKVDTIGAWQKCPVYGDVRFIESPSKNPKSSKVNIKSSICHDFPSPDLLEGLNDRKIKENAKFYFILKSSDKFHYISSARCSLMLNECTFWMTPYSFKTSLKFFGFPLANNSNPALSLNVFSTSSTWKIKKLKPI